MSTYKGFLGWALATAGAVALTAGTAAASVLGGSPSGDTGVTTETSAAIVVYPKIRVDGDEGVDTIIQLTNASEFLTKTHCFYVNANGHCSNAPDTICTQENFTEVCPGGGLCVEGWQETDFRLTLTKRQPVSWSASDGLSSLPLNDIPGKNNQFNEGNIPPVPEDPFTGELRCIQVDTTASELPIARNDLKGEAVIVTDPGDGSVDVSKYNAIGIPAIDGAQNNDPVCVGGTNEGLSCATAADCPGGTCAPNVLNIGGPNPEYNGCPNIITLDHFFDGADVVTHDGASSAVVTSRLTVVPCSADYLNQDQNLARATLQFLIYNEFEQRFSTSTRVTCYREVQLSDIDTRPGADGNAFSIFSASVQGTVTGQSRIRAVAGTSEVGYSGNAVLAILEESWEGGGNCPDADGDGTPECTATTNVQFIGVRDGGDQIVLP